MEEIKMTDIDIQALRDFMAEKVMGWSAFPEVIPEDLGELYRNVWYGLNDEIISRNDWHPDLDSNQLDMLVDKMVNSGYEIIRTEPVGKKFECSVIIDSFEIIHPDRRLAVLLAIKAAKEGE